MTTTFQAFTPVHIDDTICLTFARHTFIIVLGTQEKYGHGTNQNAHLLAGMDATGEGQEGITKAVSLRSETKQGCGKRHGMAISGNAGKHDRREDTSKAEIALIPKNDFDPSTDRRANLRDGP